MIGKEDVMLTALWILSLIGNVLSFSLRVCTIHTEGRDIHFSYPSFSIPLSFICFLKGSVMKEGLARKHHSFSSQILLSGFTVPQKQAIMSLREAEERLVLLSRGTASS